MINEQLDRSTSMQINERRDREKIRNRRNFMRSFKRFDVLYILVSLGSRYAIRFQHLSGGSRVHRTRYSLSRILKTTSEKDYMRN